jgi:hypothetical protein
VNPCRYGTRQDGRLGSVVDTLVAERLGTALVVTFEQRPRRGRRYLRDLISARQQAPPAAGDAPLPSASALAMFLVSPGTLADQEVTSLASLIAVGCPRQVWRACGGSRPRQVPDFACLWRCGAWFAIAGPCCLELRTIVVPKATIALALQHCWSASKAAKAERVEFYSCE